MVTLYHGLANAYIMFSLIMGVWALVLAVRSRMISGNFWGAMWTNSGLAAFMLLVALIMTAQGLRPYGTPPGGHLQIRWVFYLYAVYFVISLPGLFTLLRGNDKPRAAIWFSFITFFNAAAMLRADRYLVEIWK